jgi:polyisoprenoid-binding protein YceI
MRKMIRYAAAVLPLLIPVAGWTTIGEQLMLQPQSKVWVEGGSTIRAWSCKADDVNATVEAGAANAVNATLAGEKAIKAVDVIVAVEKMDCGNGTMNDHMKNALKAKDFQAISFHLNSYDVAKSADGIAGTLNGTLTLGGVKKPIAIPATGMELGGALRVTGTYNLKMTDFELSPPSLMFGRIKVRDEVTVKFDLVLKS